MAMRVQQYEQRQVVQARQPVGVAAAQSGMGQIARGLSDVGQMFDQWQADVDEADAKAADTAYSDRVRKALYEDGTGYLYAQGGDALSRRKMAAETLQKDYDEILNGLSPKAREMAQASLESRRQSALTSVDRHAGGERITYLNGQADARVKSAIDDAIIDPAHIDRSLTIARNEVAETGARNGWSSEQTAAKMAEAEGAIHGGIITRLANVDPVQALDYLNAHRDKMEARDVARLEGALLPEAKRARGRQIGRDLAQQSAGGIDDSYYASIRTAESGGNDMAKNPNSTATGRYQFVAGTWSQLMKDRPDLGLTANGRTDPAQQERAIRAFTEANAKYLVRAGVAITNGTLYAAHFLGAGGAAKVLTTPMSAAVSEIVGPAVVRANGFLSGMTVADFMSWAEKKGGGSAPMPMGNFSAPSWDQVAVERPRIDPVTQILNMEDPDERAAAMQEYQLWNGQIAIQQKAAQDAAQQAAFALIEAGGSVDNLTLDQKLQIGQSGMASLRTYEGSVRKKEPIQTDDELFVSLSKQAVTDPKGFAAADPLEWRNRLSDSDFKAFVQKQADILTPEKAPKPEAATTISTINTVSSDLLKAAGIDDKKPAGAKRITQMQSDLLRWAAQHQADNGGKAPTQVEIFQRAQSMLTPVVIDPPGMFNEREGLAFDLDMEGITPADIRDGTLTIGGTTVDPAVVEVFVQEFSAALGRAPTSQEVIEGLAASESGDRDLSKPVYDQAPRIQTATPPQSSYRLGADRGRLGGDEPGVVQGDAAPNRSAVPTMSASYADSLPNSILYPGRGLKEIASPRQAGSSSRPARDAAPSRASAPTLGSVNDPDSSPISPDVNANLGGLVKRSGRLLGGGSEAYKRLDGLISREDPASKMQAERAITAMISEVRGLPRTAARDELLADLYEARDDLR